MLGRSFYLPKWTFAGLMIHIQSLWYCTNQLQIAPNALQFHNFTHDFTSFGSLQPWAHFQSFHTVCSIFQHCPIRIIPTIWEPLYNLPRTLMPPRWCPCQPKKKSPAFSSFSPLPPGKSWHQIPRYTSSLNFGQFTWSGPSKESSTSWRAPPPVNDAPGHHVLMGEDGGC